MKAYNKIIAAVIAVTLLLVIAADIVLFTDSNGGYDRE